MTITTSGVSGVNTASTIPLMASIDTRGGWLSSVIVSSGPHLKILTRLFTNLLVLLLPGCASIDQSACRLQFDLIHPVPLLDLGALQDVPRHNRDREALVYSQFQDIGCDDLQRQRVSSRAGSNLVCTVRGSINDEILIGAHHDKLGLSAGIADNWTGIAALLGLAEQSLSKRPIHTLKFVAFAGEELDLLGSRAYVDNLERTSQRMPVAMINLDTLGIASLAVDRRSSHELHCLAQATAHNAGFNLQSVLLGDITGDWEPFQRAGTRVLGFHSVNKKNIYDLHNSRDQRSLINDVELQKSYGLIANMLEALDRGLDLLVMQD